MAQVSDHYDGSARRITSSTTRRRSGPMPNIPRRFRLNRVMRILKSRNVASVYNGAAEEARSSASPRNSA